MLLSGTGTLTRRNQQRALHVQPTNIKRCRYLILFPDKSEASAVSRRHQSPSEAARGEFGPRNKLREKEEARAPGLRCRTVASWRVILYACDVRLAATFFVCYFRQIWWLQVISVISLQAGCDS